MKEARQDETESKEFACFLADVAVGLDMTPDQLRPFLGTKPLHITKATYLKKKVSMPGSVPERSPDAGE